MVDPDVAGIAFARAWKVYLLINKDVDENDARRATLKRFIRQKLDAGVEDAEVLVVDGLKHLKHIDQSGAASPE
jgi:hypothetical protein